MHSTLHRLLSSRLFLFCIVLIIIDLITKLLAYRVLPFQQDVWLIDNQISLYLTVNETSTGTQAKELIGNRNINQQLLTSSVIMFLTNVYIWLAPHLSIKPRIKWIIGILVFLILTILMNYTAPFSNLEWKNWTVSLIQKTTGITFLLTLVYWIKIKHLKIALLLIVSGGIGNVLSLFYAPYKIIDFIYIKGTLETFKIGIFNIADLTYDIGIVSCIVSVIFIAASKIKSIRLTN